MLETKMKEIKGLLYKMANLAEEMVRLSVKALTEKKIEYTDRVISELEPQVNQLDIIIDEHLIKAIALYSPEARDLRTLMMISKMVIDLERVGDLSVNISEFARKLIPQPDVKPYIDLPKMAEIAIQMLDDALTAFISHDTELAREICKRDDVIDMLNDSIIEELTGFMTRDPATVERAILIIRICENLERIADQATNIGEYVVYIVESKIIKHHFFEQE